MNTFLLYLILQLDSLRHLMTGCCFLLFVSIAIVAFVGGIRYSETYEEEKVQKIVKQHLKWGKKLILAFTLLFAINGFIPSTKTAVMLYVIPKITKSEYVRTIPPLILKYMTTTLKSKNEA